MPSKPNRAPARSNGKHPGGQPTIRTPENALIICEAIANGSTLSKAAESAGIARSTLTDWESEDEQFAVILAHAKTKWADAAAELGLSIAEQEPRMITADDGTERVDSGWVQHVTSRLNYLKWLIAKRAPTTYGDRADVNLNHTGTVEHHHTISEDRRKDLMNRRQNAITLGES